jgi:hypothetical protein
MSSRSRRYRSQHGASGHLDAAEYFPSVQKEDRPRLGEAHASRGPHEEGCSQFVLEPPDLAAHGGLGDAELLGSAADVTLFGHGHEVLDLGETHADERIAKRRREHIPSAKGEIQTALDTSGPEGQNRNA